MAGSLTVTGASAGLASGMNEIGPVTALGTGTIGERRDLALTSGDNAVAVPSGAVAALIVLPSALTGTVKVRTNLNSSDGGVQIASQTSALFTILPLPSGTTTLYLNGSGVLTGTTEVTFI